LEKKPDSYVENAKLLPYGSNIGEPSIKIENIDAWKQKNVQKVNAHLQTRLEELKEQYRTLVEEYDLNQLVYSANYNFEPITGETYYLYQNAKGLFLSIITPTEWRMQCLGAFQLDSNNLWKKILY
jgi:hypothetical protein